METVRCPLCNSADVRQLWSKGQVHSVQCRDCSLVYENPRLSEQDLVSFYSQESYFISAGKDDPGSGYTDYFSQVNRSLIKEYLNILEQYAPKQDSIRFLDIGCGPGLLLQAAQEKGWDATGVEVSAWAVTEGKKKGLRIFAGPLPEAAFSDDSFDIISMFDVLEHIPYPVQYVREIRRILARTGVVVTETPNVAGFFAKNLYKADSEIVKPNAHICLYSPITARRLFAAGGFSRLMIDTFPYCRHYTLGYFKSVLLTRLTRQQPKRQLTYDESMRIVAWK